MSAELKVSVFGRFIKSLVNEKFGEFNLSRDITGKETMGGTGTATTGDATLDKGAIGTIGFLWLKNTGSTNAIRLGSDGSSYPIECQPGMQIFTGWNGASVHQKSAAGTSDFKYLLIEK